MTKASRALLGVSAIGVLALALSACSGGGSSAPSASSTAWDGSAIPSAVISLAAQTTSFDPTVSVSATDRAASSLMNSSLFTVGTKGQVVPALAKSITFTSDYTGATVTLRTASFSDGSPITANDVKATIDREKAVKSSTIASTTGYIASVTAVNSSTVTFAFTKPYPSFEGDAGLLAVYPASAMADPTTYFAAPTVTSGQYTITSGWASNKLQLTANPKYWGGKPAVDKVTLSVIPDGNSALSQLQSGQIDFAGDLAPNYVRQLGGSSGPRVEATDLYGFYDLRLQNSHGIFSDAKVRKAVNAAIDRPAIVKAIWGSYNTALSGFWPQSMAGYDASYSVKPDLAAAKKLLAGTACASGCTADMIYSDQDFAFSGQLALMVQQELAKIGITVKLENLDGATEVDRLFAGNFDLAPGAMASNGNTPDQLLNLALNGEGPLKAEFTRYNSPAMNAYIKTAVTTTGAARKAAATEIEKQFATDQPLLTLATWVRESATRLPRGVFQLVGPYAVMASQK